MLAELASHPHAQAVLEPALAPGGSPSHAYLFHGPGGSGKAAAAREFAAQLLMEGSVDPRGARGRALAGTHPDLTWVSPSGAHEILVADIDEPVVAAAAKTPFESTRRVFVIERADELGDEAANRMLKTLEEPPSYVHLILISQRPMDVLATIRSRCLPVRFDAPPPDTVAASLAAEGVGAERAVACARLALGDASLARELASAPGEQLRRAAEGFARAVAGAEGAASLRPWEELIGAVRARGELVRSELEERQQAQLAMVPAKERKRLEGEWNERIKRGRRRRERTTLDLGLQLVSLWFSDLACLAWGADDLVRNRDRGEALAQCAGAGAAALLAAVDAVEETRSRFVLNVSEELACEALAYRLEGLLEA